MGFRSKLKLFRQSISTFFYSFFGKRITVIQVVALKDDNVLTDNRKPRDEKTECAEYIVPIYITHSDSCLDTIASQTTITKVENEVKHKDSGAEVDKHELFSAKTSIGGKNVTKRQRPKAAKGQRKMPQVINSSRLLSSALEQDEEIIFSETFNDSVEISHNVTPDTLSGFSESLAENIINAVSGCIETPVVPMGYSTVTLSSIDSTDGGISQVQTESGGMYVTLKMTDNLFSQRPKAAKGKRSLPDMIPVEFVLPGTVIDNNELGMMPTPKPRPTRESNSSKCMRAWMERKLTQEYVNGRR